MENLSIATKFCGPSLQRPENWGENCGKNRKTFRLDSLVWDFDNGMNAKCFDEGVRTQYFPTAFWHIFLFFVPRPTAKRK